MSFLYAIFGKTLGLIYNFVNDYALSIIVFTILVKLLLYPLNLQQIRSSKAINEIQPKLKELQEKYKNDKETLAAKQMDLYKQHHINPMAGCLPLLIQLPIIFALFGTLRDPIQYVFNNDAAMANEALSKGFLWIKDLAAPDTLSLLIPSATGFIGALPGIMPILAAAITYWQMNSMYDGQQVNEQMKTMNKILPFVILFTGRTLSAGVLIYWIISSLFQLVQQKLTGHLKKKEA